MAKKQMNARPEHLRLQEETRLIDPFLSLRLDRGGYITQQRHTVVQVPRVD